LKAKIGHHPCSTFLKILVDSCCDLCKGIGMNLKQIKQLKRGDKVFWEDPDGGACSRIYNIKTIEVVNPEMVRIVDKSGDVLECLPKELKPVKKFAVKVYWEMSAEIEVEAGSKSSAASLAIDAPLPSSDTWQYVPDSANVDEEVDIQEIKE